MAGLTAGLQHTALRGPPIGWGSATPLPPLRVPPHAAHGGACRQPSRCRELTQLRATEMPAGPCVSLAAQPSAAASRAFSSCCTRSSISRGSSRGHAAALRASASHEGSSSRTLAAASPQRAAAQRAAAPGAPPAVAAAAAASLALQCATSPEQAQQEQQAPQQQQHEARAAQQASGPQARVWVPDKQLWVPRSTAVATGPVSGGAASCSPARRAPALSRVFMASAATRGHKRSMEDRHVLAALDPRAGVTAAHGPVHTHEAVSVAAVFDGHAGDATASFAAQHIPQLLHSALSGRPGNNGGRGPLSRARELLSPTSALAASFRWFDHWWADARCDPELTEHGWDESGSTAVVGLVSGQQLVVANAGDSIALLARGRNSHRLTVEHRLANEQEAERVREAGGHVVQTRPGGAARVVGSTTQTRFKGSMVTRSLGDFAFKAPQPLLSAEPHVSTHVLEPCDRLVLLTSDGVTDVLHDDDLLGIALAAVEQAQTQTNHGAALAKVAAQAVMSAALERGSTDNITAVAMLLDWGGEFDHDEP